MLSDQRRSPLQHRLGHARPGRCGAHRPARRRGALRIQVADPADRRWPAASGDGERTLLAQARTRALVATCDVHRGSPNKLPLLFCDNVNRAYTKRNY